MGQKIAAPKSVYTVPLVQKGTPITAKYLNTIATAVNDLTLNSPRDLDAGVDEEEVASVTLQESARTSETVRITNPEDEEQYVDVERPLAVDMRRSDTGELWILVFNN